MIFTNLTKENKDIIIFKLKEEKTQYNTIGFFDDNQLEIIIGDVTRCIKRTRRLRNHKEI